jgi:nitronate monooxygenase
MILDDLRIPIVLAPLAGGPSTPELAAAVSNCGGLGFLASGYLSPAAFDERLAKTAALTRWPFGVNLFVVPDHPDRGAALTRYAEEIAADVASVDAELGPARVDDDGLDAKLALLCSRPVEVVSFTFGLPQRDAVERLHAVGSEVWVTVTSAADAVAAERCGADVLVVQGVEAGGHRGGLADDGSATTGLLALLQLVRDATTLPLVATGGIATGAGIAAVLAAGAQAAALGTAFLDCPEAGTSEPHRRALHLPASTALTRAFTGRTARGIRNAFLTAHTATAPEAYPEVHHLTAPMRAAARERGNAELVNLWAGEAHALTRPMPAGELVQVLAEWV